MKPHPFYVLCSYVSCELACVRVGTHTHTHTHTRKLLNVHLLLHKDIYVAMYIHLNVFLIGYHVSEKIQR